MNDLISLLRFLTDTGSAVVPWLIVAAIVFGAKFFAPKVSEWLDARAAEHKAQADLFKQLQLRDGERGEVMRNNTAALEACAEVLHMVREDRKHQDEALAHHDEMSAERMQHLQTVLNTNNREISKIRGEVGILLDRVK